MSALAAVEPLDECARCGHTGHIGTGFGLHVGCPDTCPCPRFVTEPEPVQPVRKGRNGGDHRGSATSRRRQREYLVECYRADVDIADIEVGGKMIRLEVDTREGLGELYTTPGQPWQKACRCYVCGTLLTVDEVTRDRIKPGCEGGRYVRPNLRPACSYHNSSTGGRLGAARKRAKS